MQEFVREWLEKNNLSKLKSVFKGHVLRCEMNVHMMRTLMDLFSGKEGKNISSA